MNEVIPIEGNNQKPLMNLDFIYNRLLELGMTSFRVTNGYDDKNIYAGFKVHGAHVSIREPLDDVREFYSSLSNVLEKRMRFEA